jgi:hypothetical protein
MASRQGIDSAITSRLEADQQYSFFAVEAQFDTDTVRLWTGIDDITINSNTYTGAGSLLSISGVEDNFELKSTGLTVSVSGMNEEVLGYALSENYQNRFLTLFLGYVMGGSNEVSGVMTLFKGRMTELAVSDSTEGANILVNAENRLVDLKRPSNLRYTKNSQKYIDANDTGYNRVNSIQDMEIVWGRAGNTGSASQGGRPRDDYDYHYGR